ncbi:MAG: ABC transporter substrate-binding protein, partial [Flavobacterium sp.]|nr:ABC transporter substrate-binding protein [Flavobacterium sp.]
KKVLQDPAVKKRIEDTGSLVVGNSPQEFAKELP